MTNEQYGEMIQSLRIGWVAGHVQRELERDGDLKISTAFARLKTSTHDEVVSAIEHLDCHISL
jgi:hypothetical protein